ncbi:MAG TPA: NfeD family protein [Candidatus Tectomicrobia bacterium]|nr:NfeD family protein [Candidatus Tectomicrobia bacterium]
MPWWAWWGLGLLLILLELLTPLGFYLIFFGVGALLVGGLAGLLLTVPPWAEWLLFAACSILAMLVFRRPVLTRFHAGSQRSASDSMVGETALALEDIAVGAIGRVELRGTTWNARNFGAHSLSGGQRCTVEKSEGLLLWVRAS